MKNSSRQSSWEPIKTIKQTGYLSPKKNFTSFEYRISRTVPTTASQISHTFIECHHSKQFFHKVLQQLNVRNMFKSYSLVISLILVNCNDTLHKRNNITACYWHGNAKPRHSVKTVLLVLGSSDSLTTPLI